MKSIKSRKMLVNIALMVALIVVFLSSALWGFEVKLQDRLYTSFGITDPNIYVIGFDEKSMIKMGRFQDWTRQTMADAINILNSDPEFKPAVIGIDVLYSGESLDPAADAALAKACADGGNVVMASQISYGVDVVETASGSFKEISVIKEYEQPYGQLLASSINGFINTRPDDDYVVRHGIYELKVGNEIENSFAYEIFKKYTGETNISTPKSNSGDFYISYTGDLRDYYGIEGDGHSFSNIFEEDFDPTFFADGAVLIGPYASGLNDAYLTPVNSNAPMNGVEIHANILQQMVDNNFKTYIPKYIEFIILLVSMVALTFLFNKLEIRISLVILLVYCGGYVILNKILFEKFDLILTLLYPVIAVCVLYLFQVIYGYVSEVFEKQKIKASFKKYVDPKLVDRLILSGESDSNEVGAKKNIAVLFVDIRGFTPMSEKLKDEPETVVKILNEYLELTSNSVFNNGGSVDKFIGDATMALFNGFIPLDDYVFCAVKTALDMVAGAVKVNQTIFEKYGVDVNFGVGVSCGNAIVGNIGPSFRKDFTAIGDVVNTAARLESNAKAGQVLISPEVYAQIKERVVAESLGFITMKGKGEMEIFKVLSLS